MKTFNFSDTIYNICLKYPGLDLVLKDIGFPEIVNPAMRNTAGKFMTLEKGAKLKGINLETIKEELKKQGYILE